MRFASCSAVLALMFSPAVSLPAQSAAASAISAGAVSMTPPIVPIRTLYRFWPLQFVQFVGTELPYSQIMLEVDPAGKKPTVVLTLTDRATGKRVHYAETEALVAMEGAGGDESHRAAMAWEPADTEAVGSVSTLRLTLADGKPLVWRFVQGSDVSERGGGMTPLPGSKVPIFAYREQAAVAGEGTALEVGGVASPATVWTEISQPPYFVAYRGAMSENAHTLVFLPGASQWTVKSAPATMAAGGSWELEGAHGDRASVRIDSADGAHAVMTATDLFEPGVQRTIEATRAADGSWSFGRVRFAPLKDGAKHTLTMEFATPLNAGVDSDKVTVTAGKKTVLGTGTVTGGAGGSMTLVFSDPAWMKGFPVVEGVGKP